MTKKKELAKVGDPLVAMNGDLILEESDGYDDNLVDGEDIPPSTPVPFSEYRPSERRVTKDLRATKDALNAAGVVFTYTLLGISDAEISENTGLSSDAIARVRADRAYSEVFEKVMHALINANAEYIEARISAHSGMALSTVYEVAKTSQNSATRLSAAKDLLDRGGHRPQDRGVGASGLNELRIVITKADESESKITINSEEL